MTYNGTKHTVMLNRLRCLMQRYRLWKLAREVKVLEKYGRKDDPRVQRLIQEAQHLLVREKVRSCSRRSET